MSLTSFAFTNKANSRIFQKFLGNNVSRSPLALYQDWFLESGSWNTDKFWVDSVPWVDSWFLSSGRIEVFGLWDDSEAW